MLRIPGKLSFFALVIISSLLSAQEPGGVRANYKQAELYSPDFLRQRIYSSSVSPSWIGETDRFWYDFRTSEGTRYWIVDPGKRKKDPLFDHEDLAAKLSIELRTAVDAFALPISDGEVNDEGTTFSFTAEKTRFELNLESGALANKGEAKESPASRRRNALAEQFRRRRGGGGGETPEAPKEKDPRAHRNFSPDRTAYVFIQEHDLYYVEAPDEVKKEIAEIEAEMKLEKEQKAKAEKEGTGKTEGVEQEKQERKEQIDVQEEKEDVEKKEENVVQEEKEQLEEKVDEKKDEQDEEKDTEKQVEERRTDEKKGEGGEEKDTEPEKKEKDDVDPRERWADSVDESQALRLSDDGEEDFEFVGGGGMSRRRSELELEDANQYGWDENDPVERARLLGAWADDDEIEKKDEEREKDVEQEVDEKKKENEDVEKKEGEEKKDTEKQGEGQKKTKEKEEPEKSRPAVSWSRDSSAFHVTRRDSRGVGELFLVHSLPEPRPTLETFTYPMPGEEKVVKTQLWVFDRTRKDFSQVQPLWKDEGYSDVHWGKLPEREPIEEDVAADSDEPDQEPAKDEPKDRWKETGAELRFLRRDRLMRNVQLVSLNVRTGEAKPLIEEGFEKGNIDTQGVRYLKDRKDELLWWSERTGWGHYYLYQWDGTLKNAVTSGPYRASRILEVDEEKGLLYFRGNAREAGENVYYEHTYRVFLDGTDLRLIDPGNATHASTLSPTNNFLVDNYSRVDLAPGSVLRDASGAELLKLEEMDLSRLHEAGWKMPETFTFKAADGVTDLFGNMWKPFDFDPKKRYPIIAEVYPGPQTEGVSATFSASNSRQQLAQVGFVVVQLGHRGGTPDRSKAYQIHSYFDLRDYGLADKKSGLEQLASRYPFIDLDRIGIYGHSGGGFMTAAALLREPYNEFFKVGVASAGNHDNNIYNQWWSERYHGLKRVEVEVKQEEKREEAGARRGGGRQRRNVEQKKEEVVEKLDERRKDGDEKKEEKVVQKTDDDEKVDEEKKKGEKEVVRQTDGVKKDDGKKKDEEVVEKTDNEKKEEKVVQKTDEEKKDEEVVEKTDDGKKVDGERKKDEKVEEKKTEVRFEIEVPTNAELAANLRGHLFLVHGEVDNNVHPASTLRLADALIKANKRFDMMILPGQRHGFGPYTDYFNRMRWEYFAEHLLGDYRTGADIDDED